MPLVCNESSAEKTMNIAEEETFVKENHILSRERVTAYTQLSTEIGVPSNQSSYSNESEKISSHSLLKVFTLN